MDNNSKGGKEPKKDVIVADTNILVHNPSSIITLRKNGKVLVIPWGVILELNGLKERPDIGYDAREAIRIIEEIRKDNDDSLIIFRNPSFRNLADLDRRIVDHQVVATATTLRKKNEFGNIELISRDHTVRILARELGIKADDYLNEKVDIPEYCLKEVNVKSEIVSKKDLSFTLRDSDMEGIGENDGVICYSDFNPATMFNGKWRKSFASIRKGNFFSIIPLNISAMGLTPYSLNGDGENWYQYVALAQLLNPAIKLVFLQGGAGSGKTLLAIASAIEQRKQYRQIIVTRPMVHLEDEDRMGFLPGDEKAKMSPWLRPIIQAIDLLKEVDDSANKSLIEKMIENKKIDFESLDYIRGMTFFKTFLVVDESQNLTPHQFKTIITRAGEGTKIVFTGDLGQIDRRRRLDKNSSGLAYAIATMKDHPSVGVTNFKETVRSPLAKLAEERM